MSNQRFKYYTAYEVDNEPSEDEEENPSTKAITNGYVNSESSDDEFDQPIREFINKTMSQSGETKSSALKTTTSNAFADEMEDELDQIYHNFISRGAFELPISTQKNSLEIKTAVNDKHSESSSSDDDDVEKNETVKNPEEQEKLNDELLYDPDEEEEDEKWMNNQRIKSQGRSADGPEKPDLGPTDAVLNCPGCMVLICHDCQRHELIKNQYRAMFVFNCTIDENRIAKASTINEPHCSKKKKNKSGKRFKGEEKIDANLADDGEAQSLDILRPVICSECGTEVGVYETKEELYHFANVLASH